MITKAGTNRRVIRARAETPHKIHRTWKVTSTSYIEVKAKRLASDIEAENTTNTKTTDRKICPIQTHNNNQSQRHNLLKVEQGKQKEEEDDFNVYRQNNSMIP